MIIMLYVCLQYVQEVPNLEKSHNMTNTSEGVTPAQLQIQGRKSHELRQVNS
jgi:hypothetical protein